MKALIGLALAAAMATPAHAAVHHNMRINCGWPHPDAACHAPAPAPTPPERPTPSASVTPDPTDTGGIISALVNVRAQFVTDLQAVATMAATPDPVTGQSWDPTALWCIDGTPAQGTQGQPGYIPAYGGLTQWVNSINLPTPATNPVPPVPAGGGIAAQAEELWLQAIALQQNAEPVVNGIVSQLTNLGPPQSVMNPCGALIQNRLQTGQNAAMTTGAQLAMFNAILLKYLPQAAILGHVRMVHR